MPRKMKVLQKRVFNNSGCWVVEGIEATNTTTVRLIESSWKDSITVGKFDAYDTAIEMLIDNWDPKEG